MLVAVAAVVLACVGTATAARMISGKDIKKESITGDKLADKTVGLAKLSTGVRNGIDGAVGPPGPQGPAGPQGAPGPAGPAGPAAGFSAEPWGAVYRNMIGTPIADYRLGPWERPDASTPAAAVGPPHGEGSLGMEVLPEEQVGFANESEFAGTLLDQITALEMWFYTGGDSSPGQSDVPYISLEVDPDMDSSDGYTRLNFLPAAPEANEWTHAEALTGELADGVWLASGAEGTEIGCRLVPDGCTWPDLLEAFGPQARVTMSLGVAYGRDSTFKGAVDALRVNGSIYDFEPLGVQVEPAS